MLSVDSSYICMYGIKRQMLSAPGGVAVEGVTKMTRSRVRCYDSCMTLAKLQNVLTLGFSSTR